MNKESIDFYKTENNKLKKANNQAKAAIEKLLKAINEIYYEESAGLKDAIEEAKNVLANEQHQSGSAEASSIKEAQKETLPKIPEKITSSTAKPKINKPKKIDFIAFLEKYFNENTQFREKWIKTNIENDNLVPFFENMFASFCTILMKGSQEECKEILILIEKCMANPFFQQPFTFACKIYNNGNKFNKTKSKETISTDIFKSMIKIVIWKDWEKLPIIIDEIFNRIFEKPNFANFFAALFIALHEIEHAIENENFKGQIHMGVLGKVQNVVEKNTVIKNDPGQDANDQEKKEGENGALHKQLFGTLKLATNLFKNNFINFKICENFIIALLQNAEATGNEVMFDNVAEFIKDIGLIQQNANLDVYVNRLEKHLPNVSGIVGIKILELMAFRDKKWIQEKQNVAA